MSVNWNRLGPPVLAWLQERVATGRGRRGLHVECAEAFAEHGMTLPALRNWLNAGGGSAAWKAMRDLSPPPLPSNEAPPASDGPVQEVTKRENDEGIEARANGRKIRTVDDLLAHIEADLTRYEVASSEATKYEGLTKNDAGEPEVTEMFRVFVRLRPKKGPSVQEALAAMVEGAFLNRRPPRIAKPPAPRGDVWQLVVVADPHFGKYAWRGSTGGADYDLSIARQCVADAGGELIGRGDEMYAPARRTVVFLGDVFHYDTPAGTTTGGTAIDRDGRYQKMLNVGADTCVALVEQSAETAPTDVVVVPGNHDEILSCAFQRILAERFRLDGRVTVDDGHTQRKYLTWGANLVGVTHGHKAKKKLPQLMALERPDLWASTIYREYHTGHLHHQAAEWQRPIETIDGVVVRIAPSLGPADDWHAAEGFVGAVRGMETFFYRKSGGLAAMFVSARPEES